jgi:hypothetical protein
MGALTQARMTSVKTIFSAAFRMAAVKAYQGGMACADTSAHVVTNGAAGNANLVRLGTFMETVDNSGGSSGSTTIMVQLDREIVCGAYDSATGANAVTTANSLFADVYILDDHTVTTASSGNSKAGRCFGTDADGLVLVESYTL